MKNYIFLSCIIVLLFLGCSKDSDSPTDPGTGGGNTGPIDDPNGVILEGEAIDNAVSALQDMVPVPVEPSEEINGFLSSRLQAVISTAATVGRVNEILDSLSMKIIWMNEGFPIVTLKVNPFSSENEAIEFADSLKTLDAFSDVWLVYGLSTSELPGQGDSTMLANMSYLYKSNAPAAWNVKSLAISNNHRVPVLVADKYYSITPHPDISALQFHSNDVNRGDTSTYHGFQVSGIIGADFDNDLITGINPVASTLLDIRPVPISYLGMFDVMDFILSRAPSNQKFILNSSIATHPDLSLVPMKARFYLSLYWKKRVVGVSDNDFLQATAAGNEAYLGEPFANTRMSSTWSAAKTFTTPWTFDFSPDTLSAADSAEILSVWNIAQATNSNIANQLTNVLVVGASDLQGTESIFSCRPSDVRALGESIPALCNTGSNGCVNGIAQNHTGTSHASPQIAGLASYLWNLKPTLTVSEIKEMISNAFINGFVNAYAAVLDIDQSLQNAPVRKTLFDVAGSGSASPGTNNSFDEYDLELFLNKFEEYQSERETSYQSTSTFKKDGSRYDLNGNGYTGDNQAVDPEGAFVTFSMDRFDLTIDNPPVYSSFQATINGVSKSFDEEVINDLEILCYYAHSSLYTGSTVARDTLLSDCVPFQLELQMATEINQDDSTLLTVTVGYGEFSPESGIENVSISVNPIGGSASPAQGATNNSGVFTSYIQVDTQSDSVIVEVTAQYQGYGIGVDTVTARKIVGESIVTPVHRQSTFSAQAVYSSSGAGQTESQLDSFYIRAPDSIFIVQSYSPSASIATTDNNVTANAQSAATKSSGFLFNGGAWTGYTYSSTSSSTATIDYGEFGPGVQRTYANTSLGDWVAFKVEGGPKTMIIDITFQGSGFDLTFYRGDAVHWNPDDNFEGIRINYEPMSSFTDTLVLPPGSDDVYILNVTGGTGFNANGSNLSGTDAKTLDVTITFID